MPRDVVVCSVSVRLIVFFVFFFQLEMLSQWEHVACKSRKSYCIWVVVFKLVIPRAENIYGHLLCE